MIGSAIPVWRRYEILREWLKQKGWMRPVYDQCMVYDLYARENLKSPPRLFAADLNPYREKLKEYENIMENGVSRRNIFM